jgi:serine/threonine protein kinase
VLDPESSPPLELELRADVEEHLLGGGGFGAVFRGRRSGLVVAAKTFHSIANPVMFGLNDAGNLNAVLSEVMQEINNLVAVGCEPRNNPDPRAEHVIKFVGVAYSTRNGRTLPKWILSEYAAGGTLHARIYEGQPLSQQLVVTYTQQTMSGLDYLHESLNFIHCDIKPKNIMLSGNGKIKIGDLGISRVAQRIDTLTNRNTMTGCGSPPYTPPEVNAGENNTTSRDVYAWGIVIAEMLLKEEPPDFVGRAPNWHGHEWFLGRAAPRAGGLRQIMINCTKEHSQQRPTAAQVLALLR